MAGLWQILVAATLMVHLSVGCCWDHAYGCDQQFPRFQPTMWRRRIIAPNLMAGIRTQGRRTAKLKCFFVSTRPSRTARGAFALRSVSPLRHR